MSRPTTQGKIILRNRREDCETCRGRTLLDSCWGYFVCPSCCGHDRVTSECPGLSAGVTVTVDGKRGLVMERAGDFASIMLGRRVVNLLLWRDRAYDDYGRPAEVHLVTSAAKAATWLPGERVFVSNPQRGTVAGAIVGVLDPAQLPDLPGGPNPETVSAILAEGNVVQVLMIEYQHGPDRLRFAAMVRADGRCFDLRRQELTITRQADCVKARVV